MLSSDDLAMFAVPSEGVAAAPDERADEATSGRRASSRSTKGKRAPPLQQGHEAAGDEADVEDDGEPDEADEDRPFRVGDKVPRKL